METKFRLRDEKSKVDGDIILYLVGEVELNFNSYYRYPYDLNINIQFRWSHKIGKSIYITQDTAIYFWDNDRSDIPLPDGVNLDNRAGQWFDTYKILNPSEVITLHFQIFEGGIRYRALIENYQKEITTQVHIHDGLLINNLEWGLIQRKFDKILKEKTLNTK